MEEEVFIENLIKKAEKINISLKNIQAKKLYIYMNLLIEWNKKINLTAITNEEEIILKHFIDSFTINTYIENKDRILDIGTGAGFPGIPLKILNQENEFVLVDSLNKRINFLNEVCNKLELKSINCIHSRAEELAIDNRYRENFDIVTSRAVARLNTLIEYMLPFTKIDGRCICMKGPNIIEELEEAKNAISILGGSIERVESIILPNSDIERNIIVIKKVKHTESKYPRKAGIPSKQPIL